MFPHALVFRVLALSPLVFGVGYLIALIVLIAGVPVLGWVAVAGYVTLYGPLVLLAFSKPFVPQHPEVRKMIWFALGRERSH